MKPKAVIGVAAACGVLVSSALLYQFGPPGIKPGQKRVLASLRLPNGNQVYIVTRRTGSALEPYTVTLYRIDPETNGFWYYLGHQDPYWWGCSLKLNEPASDRVEIRAFWASEAAYSISNDCVAWPGRKRPAFRGQKMKQQDAAAILVQPLSATAVDTECCPASRGNPDPPPGYQL